MSHICNYCNKTFSSVYTLSVHQKTARYCIALQNISTESVAKDYPCNYCNKLFTTQSNLISHLLCCKYKQEHEKLETQRIQYETQLETQRSQHKTQLETQLETQRIQYEKQLETQRIRYENQLNSKEMQIKLLEKELSILKENLAEKKGEVTTIIDKLSKQQTVTFNGNNTIDNSNNYSVQFNKLLEQTLPYTPENILKQFGQIPTNQLRSDVDKIENIFVSHFGKCMSPLAFCTDPSRGNLVTKSEDGKPVKKMAEQVALDILTTCSKQVNVLVNDVRYRIDQDYEIGYINDKDMDDLNLQHAYLHDYLKTHRNTVTPYIKRLGNSISRTCPRLEKT